MAAGLGAVEALTRAPAPTQATRAAARPLTLPPRHLRATSSAAVSRLLPPTHVSCAAAVTHCIRLAPTLLALPDPPLTLERLSCAGIALYRTKSMRAEGFLICLLS